MDIGSADGNAQDDGDDDYDDSNYRGNDNDDRIDGNGDDENRNDGDDDDDDRTDGDDDDDDDNNDGNAYKLFAVLVGMDVVYVDSGAVTHAPPMGIARKLHATAASATALFVFGGLNLTGLLSSCNPQRLARYVSVYFLRITLSQP